jgi:hypothetical protein
MHIHGNHFQIQPTPFEVSQTARAAAESQRATETRRKLRRAAAEAAAAGGDEESLLISRWLEGAENQAETPAGYRTTGGRELG